MKKNPMKVTFIYSAVIIAIVIAACVFLYNHNSDTAPTDQSSQGSEQSSLQSSQVADSSQRLV